MPISWNEIRHRAIEFSKEWEHERREEAEAKTFWDEFFNVFGIRRRSVASFEEPVRNIRGKYGFIDLFWKSTLLAEHKSRGHSLEKAQSQATDYIQDLTRAGRHDEVPRYIVLSDFARIALHDLDTGDSFDFPLRDFHKNIHAFAFIPGYKQHVFEEQDPANLKAVDLMGRLHDALEDNGYTGHNLERYLVRVLFCLFADDTGIFDRDAFSQLLDHTREDGSDAGPLLQRVFETLNTPNEDRQRNLDELIALLPYVNGGLFSELLPIAEFNTAMRMALLQCCRFDWSQISPAIFGSLFQSVMEPRERRQLGGHYTSERDILKVVRSLFLDDLHIEFERVRTDRRKLEQFHDKLGGLNFLDPACGCGNFLVITYRELRILELEVLKQLTLLQQSRATTGRRKRYSEESAVVEEQLMSVQHLARVDVDAFYGIEISEFPVRIAEVAMWLMDHQMNINLSEAFGFYYVRLPLRKSPTVVHANALQIDWKCVLPVEQCSYILGNPPFVGKHYQTPEQREQQKVIFNQVRGSSDLDYVACWYVLASRYIQGTHITACFVSTNSITQGEQVSVLWPFLFEKYGISIQFAHRTFRWQSEARGAAHVHVVIIGFGQRERSQKFIYDYEANVQDPVVTFVKNISPYLTEATNTVVTKRQSPICTVPPMRCGNKPSDGGHLILTRQEKEELLAAEPEAAEFLRAFTGSEEFINGNMRWCLWLVNADPAKLSKLPHVMERVERVRQFRLRSSAEPTRRAASTPGRFFYISQPATDYILIPEVSSERRAYIPMGIMKPELISANTNFLVPSNSLYLFGVLTSAMHMAWIRQIGGRLESRFRYSGSMVYNTFAWPNNVNTQQMTRIASAARAVLEVRAMFPGSTLADLYDPLTMPLKLQQAHRTLDRAVDLAYRPQPFPTERARVEFLFAEYERLTSGFVTPDARTRSRPRTHSGV
ncbi:MAG: class I SAM-dependent DNA methyltransferase [Candidatus Sumerlaeaceae bacterium]